MRLVLFCWINEKKVLLAQVAAVDGRVCVGIRARAHAPIMTYFLMLAFVLTLQRFDYTWMAACQTCTVDSVTFFERAIRFVHFI